MAVFGSLTTLSLFRNADVVGLRSVAFHEELISLCGVLYTVFSYCSFLLCRALSCRLDDIGGACVPSDRPPIDSNA